MCERKTIPFALSYRPLRNSPCFVVRVSPTEEFALVAQFSYEEHHLCVDTGFDFCHKGNAQLAV